MMLKMLQIATACVSDNPTVRPSMLHVQEFLENIIVEEHSEEIRIERGESSGTKDIYSRVELIVQESAVIESEKEVSMLMCSEDDRVNRDHYVLLDCGAVQADASTVDHLA
ncbi:hypothetical protein CUMW_198840 [Citrus unshiu]|nr:hypothetical protein CUMW_198840 [Citrus unshiu]